MLSHVALSVALPERAFFVSSRERPPSPREVAFAKQMTEGVDEVSGSP